MNKVMIFAAGLGTRLRPLTDHMPKALVPVGGVPLLERLLLKLKASGFTDITLNLHHFADQIAHFLAETAISASPSASPTSATCCATPAEASATPSPCYRKMQTEAPSSSTISTS